jgi:hypothetical protein
MQVAQWLQKVDLNAVLMLHREDVSCPHSCLSRDYNEGYGLVGLPVN